jgi:predicted Zn-dependent protease
MKRGVVLLAAVVLFLAGASPSGKSPVLAALEDSVARSMKSLREKGEPPPYYLGYQVSETEQTQIAASLGGLRRSLKSRWRLLDVDVRVGDYTLDNTRRLRGSRFDDFARLRTVPFPIEDDLDALKSGVWLETDRRYRAAAERLTRVKADVAVKVQAEDTSSDFSRESPLQLVAPLPRVAVDVPAWEGRLRRLSALFGGEPEVYESELSLTASSTAKYFTNSEGSALQHGTAWYRLTLYAGTRAPDGMELYRYESFDARSLERLPEDAALRRTIETMVRDLKALRAAPVLDPYTGPAILSGKAAGVFFHEIFGHRIEGHRQKDEEEGQTFTKKIGQPVLPEFLSVLDDPTLERVGNSDLNGHYLVDDEGVKSRRVTVVERGTLKTFLMSRTPVAGFDKSNGHGRGQPGRQPVGRQGNLIVEAASTVPEPRLREMLVEEAKRQGKPFGLFFKDISGGFTFTGRFLPQAFKVTPILVYRVYADGRPDELVRGADLIGTPLVSFSRILAAGTAVEVFNGMCGAESGWVPVAAAAPSLLTAQIEVQKKEKGTDRPPLLPPPGDGGGGRSARGISSLWEPGVRR